jgi:precorrin-8X/cobalt-precorrin-8 methylmutase
MLDHPITQASFRIIDQEIGSHTFNLEEYALVRRVIHTTADFEFAQLLRFSNEAIAAGIAAIQAQTPIIVDVSMVRQGIQSLVAKTFYNPIICGVEQAEVADTGRTRTETGILRCYKTYPQGIYVIGNAPTALLALCDQIRTTGQPPPLVIGVPVGFVAVVESKQALAALAIPQIRVEGRKGGSTVAAALVNALLLLAWSDRPS